MKGDEKEVARWMYENLRSLSKVFFMSNKYEGFINEELSEVVRPGGFLVTTASEQVFKSFGSSRRYQQIDIKD